MHAARYRPVLDEATLCHTAGFLLLLLHFATVDSIQGGKKGKEYKRVAEEEEEKKKKKKEEDEEEEEEEENKCNLSNSRENQSIDRCQPTDWAGQTC